MKLSYAFSGLIVATGLATSAMAQDCSRPQSPAVPDGSAATEQQMGEAHQAIKAFMASTDTYLSCLEGENKSFAAEKAKDTATPEKDRQKQIQEKNSAITIQHNAAVDEMQRVAGEFNNSIRAFKAKNP